MKQKTKNANAKVFKAEQFDKARAVADPFTKNTRDDCFNVRICNYSFT